MIKNTIDKTAFLALIDRHPYLVDQIHLFQEECFEKTKKEVNSYAVELIKLKFGILASEFDLETIANEFMRPWEELEDE